MEMHVDVYFFYTDLGIHIQFRIQSLCIRIHYIIFKI